MAVGQRAATLPAKRLSSHPAYSPRCVAEHAVLCTELCEARLLCSLPPYLCIYLSCETLLSPHPTCPVRQPGLNLQPELPTHAASTTQPPLFVLSSGCSKSRVPGRSAESRSAKAHPRSRQHCALHLASPSCNSFASQAAKRQSSR